MLWGLIGVALTLALTLIGSDGLAWFDATLIGYFFGVVFMVFGVLVPLCGLVAAAADGDAQPSGLGRLPGAPVRNLAALVTFPLTLVVRRLPLRYHPSLVFPLGMYSAATFRMRAAIDLDALAWLPRLAFAAALLAWLVTAFGLAHRLVRAGGARC